MVLILLEPLVWDAKGLRIFFHWEENKRFAFYFTKTNLPFVKALVEDYLLDPIDNTMTRFTYAVEYEPALTL